MLSQKRFTKARCHTQNYLLLFIILKNLYMKSPGGHLKKPRRIKQLMVEQCYMKQRFQSIAHHAKMSFTIRNVLFLLRGMAWEVSLFDLTLSHRRLKTSLSGR